MLLQKAEKQHEKKMKHAYKKSIRKFKRMIKQNIKDGNKYCYFDKDDAYLFGYDRAEEESIYNQIIPVLQKYYKGDIEFSLEEHEYFNTYLRIRAKIVN